MSAWLGAFEGKSDNIALNAAWPAEADGPYLSGHPGPFRLVIDGLQGGRRVRVYPDEAACHRALRAERAMERRDGEGEKAGAATGSVWVLTGCFPVRAI